MTEREVEKILKALANKRRLSIIKYLNNREASVGDIAEHIKLSFKSTSRHLSVLLGTDCLEREQRGLLAFYKISREAPEFVRNILKSI